MKVEISVTCRVCGREFEPTPADVRAGRWHVCHECRVSPAGTERREP